MDHQRLKYLLDHYHSDTLSDEESRELDHWFRDLHFPGQEFGTWVKEQGGAGALLDSLQQDMERRIRRRPARIIRMHPLRYVAAACILLLFTGIAYLFLNKKPAVQQTADIPPGTNKAILSTHGRRIVLADVKTGTISRQNGVAITKTGDGQIGYHSAEPTGEQKEVYDTLTIPRGGQHHLTLADGTQVWLNAATQLRYPESFTGNSRRIELIYGEAYFEVVHNTKRPFLLTIPGQTIEDLGTHFNVSSYSDEPGIKTTLLEGKVKITAVNQSLLLDPGEQAVLSGNSLSKSDVDTDEAVAWTKGKFSFSHQSIESIMRTLSRWYDVQPAYRGTPAYNDFSGSMSRFENISQALRKIELTNKVHFKIEGRRVIVMK